MQADVALINPGASKTIYQGLSDELTAIEPPIWIRIIAGWLRDHGFKVSIIDQEAERLSPIQVSDRVKQSKARLAAIVAAGHQPSASTQQMTGVRILAQALLDVKTIIIGHHASALPEDTLIEEQVDYVCNGEGPLTISGLINNDPLHLIPGLIYGLRGEKNIIISNKPAPLIPIDELHGNVWDLLPMDRYRAHTWQCLDGSQRQPYASIYTTLGCPFKCSFCMINVFQHSNTYRQRTPELVVEQIARLYHDYGVKTFKIADEMFVLNPLHYLRICEKLAELPFASELNIWAYARIDTVKPSTLNLLRRAGIRWLALGIESGSSYVRDGALKHLKDEDIKEVVLAIQDAGINVIGNYIFGLPDDTYESMQQTLNLAKLLNCEFANFYVCQAYPGSKLFKHVQSEDLPNSWEGFSQHSYETKPLPTKTLSSRDVLEFRDQAFIKFYTDPDYLKRIAKKFGNQAVKEINKMTNIKLSRKLLSTV